MAKWLVVTVFQKVFGGSFEGFFKGFLATNIYIYITGWWFQTFFSRLYLGNKSPFFFLNIFQMGGINPPTRKRYLPQEETWWLFLLQSTVFSLRKMT